MTKKHWTENSTEDYLYRIGADFVHQIEEMLKAKQWSHDRLAKELGVDKSRVSQVVNNPGNLSLRTIIRFARALGLKVSLVAYDDEDPKNTRGPIHSLVLRECWEKQGKPLDMHDVKPVRKRSTGRSSHAVAKSASR